MTVITALGDVTNMAMNRLKGVGVKRRKPEEVKPRRYSLNQQILPCDRKHEDDELHCVEYLRSINRGMRKDEAKYLPCQDYMSSQNELNFAMRATLIDWLVEVHNKFRLRPETMYLTVIIIDRYLERVRVPRRKLQCVGIVAMFIASKYEEIYPPEVVDFCQITDNAYTRDEVLAMEIDMLNRLEFTLTHPTSLMFLRRFLAVDGAEKDDLRYQIAHFLLELTLPESFALKYTPSNMAASAVYLANRLFEVSGLRSKPSWSAPIERYTQYEEKFIRPCTKEILNVLCNLRDQRSTHNNSVYRKYQKSTDVIESVPIQKVLCG